MPTVDLPGSLSLLDSLARALVSTPVDYETNVWLPLAMMVNRNVVLGSTIQSVKSPSCEMSGEMRRMCFPFPVASLSADIFSVKESFHFPHLPAADENATVTVQKYFYGLTNSSEQILSNKEALPQLPASCCSGLPGAP